MNRQRTCNVSFCTAVSKASAIMSLGSIGDALLAKKAALAKTETKDRSAAEPSKLLKQMEQNKKLADAANIEHYAESLASEMALSTLFALSAAQAEALVRRYEVDRVKKGAALSDEESKALAQLAETIDKVVPEKLGAGARKDGFFVRLSTRSPKDARIFSARMKEAVAADIKALESKAAESKSGGGDSKSEAGVSLNDKLGIVYNNQVKILAVHSGAEAVELLASSLRIYQDLVAHLEGQISAAKFDVFVVLRQWADIRPAFEFRGFVYDRKLTAISSYNRAVFWPHVAPHKKEIAERLVKYWNERVRDKVGEELKNYIVDFAFVGGSFEKIMCVELNSFYDFEGNATNAELFHWERDDLVLRGEAPFEMRLVEAPLSTEALLKTITKPYKIWLGFEKEESFNPALDHV